MPSCAPGGERASAAAQDDRAPAAVREALVARRTIHPTLLVPGAIAPSQTVALSNAIAEPAAEVYVREGDRVRAGQVLARLQTDDLEANEEAARQTARSYDARTSASAYAAQLAFAQAPEAVRQARAQARQADETLREARTNLARDRDLARQGYLPAQNVDEQRVVVRNDEQAVRSAQAASRSAAASALANGTPSRGLQASTLAENGASAAAQYATADQLRRQIARATIVSPVDGTVVNRNLNPGEYPSGRQLFTLEANDTVFAILTASAAQAYQIRAGDRALVTPAGLAAAAARGTVAAVLDAATPGSTNFTVKVAVPNARHLLRSGTPVRALIDLGGVTGAAVPAGAFTDDAHARLFAVSQGRARAVRVTERATDGVTSIVTGIAAGTHVVADGGAGVGDGDRIRAAR